MILSQSEQKITTMSMTFAHDLPMQQKHVDKIMEEYKYVFSSSTGVLLHY